MHTTSGQLVYAHHTAFHVRPHTAKWLWECNLSWLTRHLERAMLCHPLLQLLGGNPKALVHAALLLGVGRPATHSLDDIWGLISNGPNAMLVLYHLSLLPDDRSSYEQPMVLRQ